MQQKYIINARVPKILRKKIHNYIKNFSPLKYKFFFVLSNIRMMNLSLYELRQIAKSRNISKQNQNQNQNKHQNQKQNQNQNQN